MNEQDILQRKEDFEQLAQIAENFINKWGTPHSVVIIHQGGIQLYDGEMAMPLKIPD